MAYSAITAGEIDTDSPITTGLMNKYNDNILAMRDGTGISDNAIINRHLNLSDIIGQTEIKEAVENVDVASINIPSSGVTDEFTLTNPNFLLGYTWGATVYNSGGSSITINVQLGQPKSADDADWLTQSHRGLITRVGAPGTTIFGCDGDFTYISASPPYDLGDGEIPLFLFLRLASDNTPIAATAAIDPPWAYNGPTKTMPHFKSGDKLFRREKTIDEETGNIITNEIEITQQLKNADKNLIPHPFVLKPGEKAILVDPVETLELLELKNAGQRVSELFFNDYIRVKDKINRAGPDNLDVLRFEWKNSRTRAGQAVKDKRLNQGPYAGRRGFSNDTN